MMSSVLSVILGGGRGTRLFPLTKSRAKPADAGRRHVSTHRYPNQQLHQQRLESHLRADPVSEHQPASAHRRTPTSSTCSSRGFVEVLAAQQTNETARLVSGHRRRDPAKYALCARGPFDEVLILSGDQLYRMDFHHLIGTHRAARADVTVAVLPVDKSSISGFGIVKVDDSGRIAGFVEKPKTDAESNPYILPPGWLQHHGISAQGREFIANMGIYVFNRKFLEFVLMNPIANGKLPTDFGKDIFPNIVRERHVHAHVFDGFWEDLGTIQSYHEVSLQLCEDKPKFAFHSSEGIIYTRARNLPPSRISTATLDRVRVADGCIIQKDAEITHSIVGVRSRVCRGSKISDTVIIGADKIESDADRIRNGQEGRVNLGIGDNCIIKRAIIDKDCRIGADVVIDNSAGIEHLNDDSDLSATYYIRDGIVVIPRGTTIPDGTRIPSES